MTSFDDRIGRLVAIYNIPFEEHWAEWTGPEGYTVYKYWKALALLSEAEFRGIFERRRLQSNPVFVQYFRNLDYWFRPEYYAGGLVADVGSGFGFISFWLLLSGAQRVYTIGDPERIGYIRRLYDRAVERGLLPADSLSFKPSFIEAEDTSLGDEIAPASLSLILLNDTLEHITARRFPALVRAAARDLKPGGYFISKQQNTDSASMRRQLEKVWERTERETFLAQRLSRIRERLPDIANADAEQLARRTRGLDRPDFYTALERFAEQGIFPNHDTNIAPIDIDIDVPEEGDTGIARITGEFRRLGFSTVRVYPSMVSSRRSRLFLPLAKLWPGLFLRLNAFNGTSVFWIRK